MTQLIVNCKKLPFRSTLGVAHFLLHLCEELARDHELWFVVEDPSEVLESPARARIEGMARRIVTSDDARAELAAVRSTAVEILPHHFQGPEFCNRSLLACHDLHVFDIPWKYGARVDAMQQSFRRNLTSASAVLTEFPRTYRRVEQIAGVMLTNLFLTASPLLLDTTVSDPPQRPRSDGRARLVYPAQLQAHKNHRALVGGVEMLRARGRDVTIVCPGSDFADAVSDEVRSFIASSDVADAFEFVGRASDDEVVELYHTSDGAIVPSLAEGGAYVPLEAIAAGLPVAVHDIESARLHLDSLEGHVTWFDANDPTSTADAIEHLIDGDRRQDWQRNEQCRARLAATAWSDVADVWSRALRSVVHQTPRPVLATDARLRDRSYR